MAMVLSQRRSFRNSARGGGGGRGGQLSLTHFGVILGQFPCHFPASCLLWDYMGPVVGLLFFVPFYTYQRSWTAWTNRVLILPNLLLLIFLSFPEWDLQHVDMFQPTRLCKELACSKVGSINILYCKALDTLFETSRLTALQRSDGLKAL